MADVHGESFLLNSWSLGQRIWGQKPALDGGLSKLGDFPEWGRVDLKKKTQACRLASFMV
jgi:hypothetical protein